MKSGAKVQKKKYMCKFFSILEAKNTLFLHFSQKSYNFAPQN